MHTLAKPAYLVRTIESLLSEVEAALPGAAFGSAHEAWICAITGTIASMNGDRIPGPPDAPNILQLSEAAGWDRLEWHVALTAGLDGDYPECPLALSVYKSAMSKLDKVLARGSLPRDA